MEVGVEPGLEGGVERGLEGVVGQGEEVAGRGVVGLGEVVRVGVEWWDWLMEAWENVCCGEDR